MALARGMDEAETASVRASIDHLMVLNPFQYGEFRSRGQKALQAYERALVAIQNGEPVEATLNEAQRSAGY